MCEPIFSKWEKLPFPRMDRSYWRQCFNPDQTPAEREGQPAWAYFWGKPQALNPPRLLLAPQSSDVTEEELEMCESTDIGALSGTSTNSEFWETAKTVSISLSPGESRTSIEKDDLSSNPTDTGLTDMPFVKCLSQAKLDMLENIIEQYSSGAQNTPSDPQSHSAPVLCQSFKKMRPEEKCFMDLPGELRNKIYELAFPAKTDFEIVWLSRGIDLTHHRYRTAITWLNSDIMWSKLRPDDPDFDSIFYATLLNKDKTKKRRKEVWALAAEKRAVVTQTTKVKKSLVTSKKSKVSDPRAIRTKAVQNTLNGHYTFSMQVTGFRALLVVNRQVHDEAASMLYSHSTFSFGTRTLMVKFLQNLTPISRANICSIHLVHEMQNIPLFKKDSWMVDVDNRKFVSALEYLTANCPSLQTLHLLLEIRGSPITLSPTDTWFQNLTTGLRNLKNLPHLESFGLDLILGGDTSNIASVAAEIPPDAHRIARATQLVDAADCVRGRVLEEKLDELEREGGERGRGKRRERGG